MSASSSSSLERMSRRFGVHGFIDIGDNSLIRLSAGVEINIPNPSVPGARIKARLVRLEDNNILAFNGADASPESGNYLVKTVPASLYSWDSAAQQFEQWVAIDCGFGSGTRIIFHDCRGGQSRLVFPSIRSTCGMVRGAQ